MNTLQSIKFDKLISDTRIVLTSLSYKFEEVTRDESATAYLNYLINNEVNLNRMLNAEINGIHKCKFYGVYQNFGRELVEIYEIYFDLFMLKRSIC